MAAMATAKPPSPTGGTEVMPMPSRNPLPLSATQEAQVREVFNSRVRNFCADEIKGSTLRLNSWLLLRPNTQTPDPVPPPHMDSPPSPHYTIPLISKHTLS